jgi:hypothetical protein
MAHDTDAAHPTLVALWEDLGGPPSILDAVDLRGPAGVLSSVFDVTGFAAAATAAAGLAVAELAAARDGGPVRPVVVDRLSASASFRAEALLRPLGWELPPMWDPVAGDYEAADGWIRLHTNYRHHLDAALAAVGAPPDRAAVAEAVRRWKADELEDAVVAAGGCAAAMRTTEEWLSHPAGQATADERPVTVVEADRRSTVAGSDLGPAVPGRPLAGVRVLDLTRVIAGPLASRYLAAFGADVLRLDPPGFDEVGALLPETTAGKRCGALDLSTPAGRARFLELVADAHVLVVGLRPGALAGLDIEVDTLRAANPGLVVVRHDAYGWAGPWRDRRGFDSLVQMSTGIAAAGARAAGTERPTPLPAQALDHGIAHLLAAGTCRALTRLVQDGRSYEVRGSLVGAANVVRALPAPGPAPAGVRLDDVALEPGASAWGPLERVPLAPVVDGAAPGWSIDAGPLGRHEPHFG